MQDYCTILINSSHLCDCDMPDKIFCLSLCLEACDMGKISSGAALCLAVSAMFQQKLPYQDPMWQTTLSSSGLVTCDMDQISFRQVALWHVTDELIEIVQYSHIANGLIGCPCC